jgi:hypothetical protein
VCFSVCPGPLPGESRSLATEHGPAPPVAHLVVARVWRVGVRLDLPRSTIR